MHSYTRELKISAVSLAVTREMDIEIPVIVFSNGEEKAMQWAKEIPRRILLEDYHLSWQLLLRNRQLGIYPVLTVGTKRCFEFT